MFFFFCPEVATFFILMYGVMARTVREPSFSRGLPLIFPFWW